MTKLKAALAYETKKTACNLGLFVAGVAAFVGAVDLIAFASGYPGMAFSGLYAWSFLFLGFATIVAFNRDWPFFLQNGLTRAQSFGVFAAMCVFSSVALALLDGVLSSAFPAAWKAQSLVMFQIDGSSAGAFFYGVVRNLAVSFSVLAGVVLRKRAGALLTALALVAIVAVLVAGAPTLAALVSGSAVPIAGLIETVAGSPYARDVHLAQAAVLYALAAAVAAGAAWAIMRRTEAR